MENGYVHDLVKELGGSDFLARSAQFFLVTPLRAVLIVVAAIVLARVVRSAVRRSFRSVGRRQARLSAFATQRAEQRAATVAEVVASLARIVLLGIAALMVLSEVGVDLGPLLAGAGIAGIAVGLGAQSLVKDLVSGLCILLEDQFGVGDVVTVGGATGTVEDFNLRVTRVRGVDGVVHFVPNSEIRHVANASMEWSLATLDVGIGYASDAMAVGEVVRAESAAFAAEEAWEGVVLDAPEVRVVAAMSELRQTVRVVVRCAPRRQYEVAAALRLRLLAALRAAGVEGPGQTGPRITAGQLDLGTPPPPPADPAPLGTRSSS